MKYLGVLLLVLALTPTLLKAQGVPADDASQIGNTVNFVSNPPIPGPNQRVHVFIQAYGLDLGNSNITWTVNGKVVNRGLGLTSIDFTTGAIGSETKVAVSIDNAGSVVTAFNTYSPATVDLMWQGNTYTPPFYKGRALWSTQSRVTFLAVPHVAGVSGKEISPANLIYKWTKDGEVQGQSSGTGKNTLTVSDTILSLPINVEVEVMSDQNTTLASASMNLEPSSPDAVVYEDNPLYGLILNNAIGDTAKMHDPEVTFAIMPLYMSPLSRSAPNLIYTWSLNGVTTAQHGAASTFRAPDATTGATSVHVEVANKTSVLQGVSKDFLVQFGNGNAI